MSSLSFLGPSLLVFVIIFLWNSSGYALPHEGNFKVTGQEKQLDPVPDTAGEFCQRNKNPAGLGFIGVKYDLLRGNPEGNNAVGGVDPGFDRTKKILKLTTEDGDAVPIQICYEERQSCATTKSSKIFGGTKRYQEKLSVDVSAEAGYSGLFDFSFSLSSKYEQMKKSTQSGETVYRDCTEICNKGEARYRLKLVENYQWTLTEEFAADVCGLKVKFRNRKDKKTYFDFLNYWGTHVVVKVVLGTKKITRFRSSLQEFLSYASENATNSFSVSGGYAGFKASASVDVNKFEESEESKKDFGEEQLTYNIGGDSLPEPIQVTLMGIEETLTPTFWSNLEELKKKRSCKKMTLKKLGKFLRNMRQAIKQYPKEMHVKRAKDNPMELQLSWPSGYYSLFAAIYDTSLTKACPQGTGFQWRSGSITDQNHAIFTFEPNIVALFRIDIKQIGKIEDWENFGGVKYEFCTKTQDPGSQYFSQDWPKGRYCILRKSRNTREPTCPRNFEAASVMWIDEFNYAPIDDLRPPLKKGTYPDGSFESKKHLKIEFCCRQDGFVDNGIHLPLDNPFILMKVQGFPCQKVCGARKEEWAIETGTFYRDAPWAKESVINGTIKPAGSTSRHAVQLRFCYYAKMESAKFLKFVFVETRVKASTAERKCQSKGGHLASIHSQEENQKIKQMVGSGSMAWIGLKRRTVQNRPWIWTDGTELDFGEWKPDVTDDEKFVSISGDDGSWEAKTKDSKLPFVCKVINSCPDENE